jgi:hypothetical protein
VSPSHGARAAGHGVTTSRLVRSTDWDLSRIRARALAAKAQRPGRTGAAAAAASERDF